MRGTLSLQYVTCYFLVTLWVMIAVTKVSELASYTPFGKFWKISWLPLLNHNKSEGSGGLVLINQNSDYFERIPL